MTQTWISPVMLERLAGSLLHFVWQGAAIAVVAAVALRLLRRRPAEWRYAAACAALFAMFAAPFLTFAFYAETGSLTLRLLSSMNAAATLASDASAAGIAVWTDRIVFAWGIGVIVFMTRLAGGWLLSRRMVRSAAAVVTPVIMEALERARAGLNFHRKVRLLSGEHIETPVVIGWLRPAILLPASALTGLHADHLLAILAHELAHIRRHDYLVNGLQRAVECVLFYHPAVWWISGRMRVERERCCDDLAVHVCGDRLVYANALVALENARAAAPLLALPTAGAGVADRVRRILGRGSNRDWQSAAAALVFAAIFVSAGMWQPPMLAGPAVPPSASAPTALLPQPPVQQTQASAPAAASPVSALIAIATAEGVRAERAAVAEPAPASQVTQPAIERSREAARDRLGMLRVEYSAESFVKQAAEGDTIAIKTFLAAGMNINARNEKGHTALTMAAASGQTETVQSLLAAGANPNLARWEGGDSALFLAAGNGDVSTMKVLIAGGAQVDQAGGLYMDTALVAAATSGKVEAVTLLLDNKASIEARGGSRGTALIVAACGNHFDVARTLLDRGANVNASAVSRVPGTNSVSNTALHCAAQRSNPELIKLLLDKGANINAIADRIQTPLMVALNVPPSDQSKASALLLIERGADVNVTTDGDTPLFRAVRGKQVDVDVVRALLAKGANPNERAGNNRSPLMDVLGDLRREGSVEIALLLIDKGADVNAAGTMGFTPLIFAVQEKQIEVVRALLAKGADPNTPGSNRLTPLQAATEAPEIRQLLITAGARQ